MLKRVKDKLQASWYTKSGLTGVLRPFSWLFRCVVFTRRLFYRLRIFHTEKLAVPVIIVGNLTLGGTGKTPLIIAIANFLKQSGYRPAIVSRGYGGKAYRWPQQVRPDSDPVIVGDEAVMIARRTQCPMSVGSDRVAAGKGLLQYADCDIILSDDGLQHYAMARDVEIIVVDGIRRFGNGYCLPAGPLREPISRLESVDFVVTNGIAAQGEFAMRYKGDEVHALSEDEVRPLASFRSETLHAVAGIGHPQRFFEQLKKQGLDIIEHVFPDHHPFVAADIDFDDDHAVIMTEKDAIKCQRFSQDHCWYLPIDVEIKKDFGIRLLNMLGSKHGQKST